MTVETQMPETRFEFGDFVQLANRPEWGRGSVMKVEQATIKGESVQRVSVRFEHAGLKVLVSEWAELVKVNGEYAVGETDQPSGEKMGQLDRWRESEWLSGVAEKKIQEHMIALPQEIRDPFNTLKKRLRITLGLYRFERTGGSLVDWAVVQTGLRDPLSRFNRPELEQYYDRWVQQLDLHLLRLLEECRKQPSLVSSLLGEAPPRARKAVKRLNAVR